MRRIRKSTRRKLWWGLVFVALQILLVFVCQTAVKQIVSGKYEILLHEKEAVLDAARRTTYVTRQEIRAGEMFTEENTEKRCVLSEQNPEALSVEVIGMLASADLSEGVIITTSLCCEQEAVTKERRCLFKDIGYLECFSMYDAVDVRLRYANGENYCVLRKKRLQEATEGEGLCCFFLTEEEQLMMSAAQYDVEVYEGAKLYLVGFLEERLQEDEVSTYVPPVQILSQLQCCNEEYMDSFEARCSLRNELEERLAEYQKQRRNGVY